MIKRGTVMKERWFNMYFEFDGKKYREIPDACYGDFDNSTSLERANARVLEMSNEWNKEPSGYKHFDNPVFLTSVDGVIGFFTSGLSPETANNRYILDSELDKRIRANCPDVGVLNVISVYGRSDSVSYFVREDDPLIDEIQESLANYPVLDDDVFTEVEQEMKIAYWSSEWLFLAHEIDDIVEARELIDPLSDEEMGAYEMMSDMDSSEVLYMINQTMDTNEDHHTFYSGGNVSYPWMEILKRDPDVGEECFKFLKKYTLEKKAPER